MKKFIWTNVPVAIFLIFVLTTLNYNNLDTGSYIYIIFTGIAVFLMLVNIIILYIKEKKNV